MAAGIIPTVRLMFACDHAEYLADDEKWVLKHPWTVVALPDGAKFPFRVEEFWVYAQLAGGIGAVDVMVEMRQIKPDGTRRLCGRSAVRTFDFDNVPRLGGIDFAFRLKKVPFPCAGVYEFRLTCGEGVLPGVIAELRVLDRP